MRFVEAERETVAREPLPSVRRLAVGDGREPERLPEAARSLELVASGSCQLEELAAGRDVVRVPLAGRKRARLEQRDRLAAGIA